MLFIPVTSCFEKTFMYIIYPLSLTVDDHLIMADLSTPSQREITFEQFMLVLQGHAAFQLLSAGVELRLFQILSKHPEGLSSDEVSSQLLLDELPAKVLLNGLLTLGLIIRDENGKIRNAPLTNRFLLQGSSSNMEDIIGWQKHIVYPGIVDFVASLKQNTNVGLRHFPGKGNTLYERLVNQPRLEQVFQKAMQSLSAAANHELLQNIDLSSIDHLVDFGGGNGTNAIAFVRQFPNLRVTIMDSPSVCELAKENIKKHKLESQISVWPGDFFVKEFPANIDVVLYSHIVTIWSPDKNVQLFSRIYEALNDRGQVIVFSTLGNDDGIGPMITALGSVYFQSIASGEGMVYSKSDVHNFLEKAGFKDIKIRDIELDHTIVIGHKLI